MPGTTRRNPDIYSGFIRRLNTWPLSCPRINVNSYDIVSLYAVILARQYLSVPMKPVDMQRSGNKASLSRKMSGVLLIADSQSWLSTSIIFTSHSKKPQFCCHFPTIKLAAECWDGWVCLQTSHILSLIILTAETGLTRGGSDSLSLSRYPLSILSNI